MPKKNYYWEIGGELPTLGSHSLAKHRIIESYIKRYIEIVTAKPSQEGINITFVDGYCGGGRYKYGLEEVGGSPIVLLNTVCYMEEQLNKTRPKGFKINCKFIFVDQSKNHTDFLREEIKSGQFRDRLDVSINIIHADFNEVCPRIIEEVKRHSPRAGRAIFLLDQYGWSQVAFSSVRAILDELDKAEVFLTFSVDSLINYLTDHKYDMRAFGAVEMSPSYVKELIRFKEDEQVGFRALIQNSLYSHIQNATGAPFYSPFFIKSLAAYRSYWFIHLSKHREARNEIGEIHWRENNTSSHSGGAGLKALGFTPSGINPDQLDLNYTFDEAARLRSEVALNKQLPHIISEALGDGPPTLQDLFETRCNDTPVVRQMFEQALVRLRNEKEILIVDENGKEKPRANNIQWGDRVKLPAQTTILGPFSQFSKGKI